MKCLKIQNFNIFHYVLLEVSQLACAPPSMLELAFDGVDDGPVERTQMNMKKQITRDMFCASLLSPSVFRPSKLILCSPCRSPCLLFIIFGATDHLHMRKSGKLHDMTT